MYAYRKIWLIAMKKMFGKAIKQNEAVKIQPHRYE